MIDYRAEIDEILAGLPGKLAFRALCAALGRAGSPEDLLVLCAERLTSWPDELREAPWSWLAALETGHTKPAWRLVRSLALRTPHNGIADRALPDPRVLPEVRGVTHLDLGMFAPEALAALAETMDHWENLRAIQITWLTEMDHEIVAKLAGNAGLARIESLSLVTTHENLFHFAKPPFRPTVRTRLRHAGLRAPDLVHLMRSGLAPDLRSAEVLVASSDEARDLAGCAELARLERLAIGFRCGWNGKQPAWEPFFGNVIDEDDDACEEFFGRADLAGLRGLTVRGTSMGLGREGLGARGVAAIVAGGVLRQLTELTLELLPIGDAPIAGALGTLDRERIEKLTLVDLVATDVTAAEFSGAFPRLRHLDLSRNYLGTNGAWQLAADVRLPALEHLDLSGSPGGSPYYGRAEPQPLGDPGAEAWASSDNGANLTYLNLAATGLGVDGLVALMTSELARLEVLDVSFNPVGSWPAKLASAPVRRTLRTLNLSECGLGDDDIEALASTTSAPELRSVSLQYNSISSRGARALASWAVLPQLWELKLHDNVIGDDGLIELATFQAAQRLLELNLQQDRWNAGAREDCTPLPAEVVDQASFPSLDAIFLGIIDEYHGNRLGCGFPSQIREELASASTTPPALVAFLTHLEMTRPDTPFDNLADLRDTDRTDRDFRYKDRAAAHATLLDEARDFARRMSEGDIGWSP